MIIESPKVVTIVSAAWRSRRTDNEPFDHAPRSRPSKGTTASANQNDPVDRNHEPADRAQHEEVAMGNVDDVEQAKDDRKPKRDEGHDQPPNKSVHGKREDELTHVAAIDISRRCVEDDLADLQKWCQVETTRQSAWLEIC